MSDFGKPVAKHFGQQLPFARFDRLPAAGAFDVFCADVVPPGVAGHRYVPIKQIS
jgi:hypothetical protein